MTTLTEYYANEGINISTLKAMRRSPLHYLEALANSRIATRPMNVGTATHVLTFEPERFDDAIAVWRGDTRPYVVWDGGDRRGKEWAAFKAAHPDELILKPAEVADHLAGISKCARQGEAWKAFESANSQRIILTEKELIPARAMARAVREHPASKALLRDGRAELPMFWTDPVTGLDCKGRVDWTNEREHIIVDLKTARDVSPRVFSRQAERLGYALQAAFYADGYAQLHDGIEPAVYVVSVESVRPHDVIVYEVESDTLDIGRTAYLALLQRVRECVLADEWPGQAPNVVPFELPPWALTEEEEGIDLSGVEAAQ